MKIWIVAAHPDDETIGASLALHAGADVHVIHVTNGAPRDPRWWPDGIADRDSYARMRASEAEQALAVTGAQRIALGFDDQGTVFALDELTRELARLLRHGRPDLIITHPYEGGHPDHDAVAVACARARAAADVRACLLEMALYHGAPGYGAPGSLCVGAFVEQGSGDIRCRLGAVGRERRHRMLAAYASQRAVLAPFFAVEHECFRIAPAYDFTRPPHAGPLHYERLGMPPTAAEWRELVRRTG